MIRLLLPALLLACGPKDAPPTPKPVQPGSSWQIAPDSVRFNPEDETLFIQANVLPPAGTSPDSSVYLGITAVRADGEEIDIGIQEIPPSAEPSPVTVVTDVGPDIVQVLMGVWSTKIEPCEVDRYGCERFGFVLDGSLATWPDALYEGGHRQRVMPPVVRAAVVNAGSPANYLFGGADALKASLGQATAVFGTTVEVAPVRNAFKPSKTSELRYLHIQDSPVAALVAMELEVEAVHDPELRVDFELRMGHKNAPSYHNCAVRECQDFTGRPLARCVESHCP